MKRVAMMSVVLGLLVWVSGAQAVFITNGSTQLFSDGFESYSDGAVLSSPWVTDPEANSFNTTKVVASQFGVLPNEGNRLLWVRRYATNWDHMGFGAATFTPQISGTVSATFAFYVPNNAEQTSSYCGILGFGEAGGDSASSLLLYTDGTILNLQGGAWAGTTITYPLDQWNTLVIDYNINTNTVDYTINGIKTSGLSGNKTSAVVDRLRLSAGGSNSVILFDAAVPEPFTVSLLVLGGLTILRRRG